MEHDIYYERQRALIEHSAAEQAWRRQVITANSDYRHEVNARRRYHSLQTLGRGVIVRACKGVGMRKRTHATVSKCEPMRPRTKRFSGSHITVYMKSRPTW